MRSRFHEHLNECLEALASGQRTLEDCLARYPKEADRLEPLLRTALSIRGTLSVEPREEFRAAARQRFVVSSGKNLAEALREGPRPSFVKAARERFLAAAQRMVGAGQSREWRPFPQGVIAIHARPLATALATAFLLFIGFGTFAVTTSGSALPGDWRYPVKRFTEDVRLTLAFSDAAERSVKIDLANERLSEIQQMAEKGRPIGGDLLDDLKGETGSLASNLDKSGWDAGEVREVADLARHQDEVLAQVEPLVKPDAQENLVAARTASQETYAKAAQVYALALFSEKSGKGEKVPGVEVSESPEEEATEVPSVAVVPTEEGTGVEPSPEPDNPVPGGEPVISIERGSVPEEGTTGLTWDRVVIGRFSIVVPSEADGWRIMDLGFGSDDTAPAPNLLRITNADGTAIIVVNPKNGDTFWYQYKDGLYEDFIVRVTAGDDMYEADLPALEGFYAPYAAMVLFMVESITIEPPPTPTPVPTETPVPPPVGTATIVSEGLDPGASTATPLP